MGEAAAAGLSRAGLGRAFGAGPSPPLPPPSTPLPLLPPCASSPPSAPPPLSSHRHLPPPHLWSLFFSSLCPSLDLVRLVLLFLCAVLTSLQPTSQGLNPRCIGDDEWLISSASRDHHVVGRPRPLRHHQLPARLFRLLSRLHSARLRLSSHRRQSSAAADAEGLSPASGCTTSAAVRRPPPVVSLARVGARLASRWGLSLSCAASVRRFCLLHRAAVRPCSCALRSVTVLLALSAADVRLHLFSSTASSFIASLARPGVRSAVLVPCRALPSATVQWGLRVERSREVFRRLLLRSFPSSCTGLRPSHSSSVVPLCCSLQRPQPHGDPLHPPAAAAAAAIIIRASAAAADAGSGGGCHLH